MKAWVSRVTVVDGKKKYERVPPGTKGLDIGRDDRFTVFYMLGKSVRKELIETPGKPGKNRADSRAAELVASIEDGSFERDRRESWERIRTEYEEWAKIKSVATQQAIKDALDDFERIAKPKTVADVTSQVIERYAARRLAEPSKRRKGRNVSPASVNKTLRTVRAILNKAKRWGYIRETPHIEMIREPGKLVVFVTDEDFSRLYAAADGARFPADVPNVSAADWWRSLITFLGVTGWRIGSALALKWADVDLDRGTVISQADDNKGKRARRVPLPGVVVDHLRTIQTFGETFVFPWSLHRRTLDAEFLRLQERAKVKPDGRDRYTFHDFRRRVGTLNGRELSPADLQSLMDHKNLSTTMKYIRMGEGMESMVDKINIPEALRKKSPPPPKAE